MKSFPTPVSLLAPLFVLVATAPALLAGSRSVLPMTSAVEAPPRFVLDLSTQYEFSDFSLAGPGGDIFEARASIPFFIPLNERWKLIGSLSGAFTDYETDPFGGNGLQTWNVGGILALNGQLTEEWSATFGLLGGASWEEGASFSDSLNGGGLVLAEYRFSPTLKMGLGGLYLTRQNEDALVVPVLGLDWQVSDVFDITLVGLDLRAEYDVSPAWSIYLRGEFDPGGALLVKRVGSEADSFNDQGFRAAAGVKWSPSRTFSVSVEGGVAFHEYTLLNDREQTLSNEQLDPAPFVGVSARLSF